MPFGEIHYQGLLGLVLGVLSTAVKPKSRDFWPRYWHLADHLRQSAQNHPNCKIGLDSLVSFSLLMRIALLNALIGHVDEKLL